MKRCRKTCIVHHIGLCKCVILASSFICFLTHVSNDPAGPDAVIVAHPVQVVWVLPPGQDVLVAQVVGPLEQDPGTALHANRVATAEVGVELGTVTVALIITTLEVFVFIKHDLEENNGHSVDILK